MTSKIHLATDGRGRARRIIIGRGQQHDSRQALALLEDFRALVGIADKGYDSDAILAFIEVAEQPEPLSRRSLTDAPSER